MIRWPSAVIACVLVVLASFAPALALAQGGPPAQLGDAGALEPRPGSSKAFSAVPGADQAGPMPTEDPAPRPVRGPSVRERGGRRSRGASTASGAMMLVMLIGALGYYVIKRVRR